LPRTTAKCLFLRFSVPCPKGNEVNQAWSNSNQQFGNASDWIFAKIQGPIQIPNLGFEVQKKSYQRFLQDGFCASERDDGGFKSVFTSVFSNPGLPAKCALEFVRLLDRKLGECKCGNLKGLHHLRGPCRICGAFPFVTIRIQTGYCASAKCGTFNKNTPTFCNKLRRPGCHAVKVHVKRMPGARAMTVFAPLRSPFVSPFTIKDPELSGAKTIFATFQGKQEVFYGDIPA